MAIIVKDVSAQLGNVVREQRSQQARQFEPHHNDVQAIIKSVGGSTRHDTQPGKTWVSILNQPESLIPVWNNTTSDTEGMVVWIGPQLRPPFALEVKGPYEGAIAPASNPQSILLAVPDHGQVHQIKDEADPGSSPVLVYQPMLQSLKTTGDGATLTVAIQDAIYFVGARPAYFPGSYLNLSAYVPASGFTRYVLIYLDTTLNQLDLVVGATVPTGGATVAKYPDIPINGRPSAYVSLTGGQTSITTALHVDDARDPFRTRLEEEIAHQMYTQADGIHSPFRWLWADDADRIAETDVTQNDLDYVSVGFQLDNGALWRITGESPLVMEQVGGELIVSRRITSLVDGTWYPLYTDGVSGQLIIPANTVWTVHVLVTGLNKGASQRWGYELKGVAANSGGTVSVNASRTALYETDAAYDAQLAVDVANDALEVQVRRSGGTNWDSNWQASIRRSAQTHT